MSTNQIITVGNEAVASSDVREGFLTGPGFTDVPVRYSVVEGRAIYDGCIDMGPVDQVEANAARVRAALAHKASSVSAAEQPTSTGAEPIIQSGVGVPGNSAFLWPNGVVPFVIDAGLPNQQRVTDAVNHIAANTPIRFVARGNEANYVRFASNGNANFSSSPVGMQGGEQVILISNGSNMGVIAHECLHTLGVLHEQSRSDRDSFVKINYQNVDPNFVSNFDKFGAPTFRDYFEYDYGSIMHYPKWAFSTNGQDTIVPLAQGVTIGQRDGLSYGDRLTLAEMYRKFAGDSFHGVWRAGNGGYGLWVNATWDQFVAKWQEWGAQGLRLTDVQVRNTAAGQRYSGVWNAGSGGYALWGNANWDSFVAKWQEWGAQGLRLVDMHVLRVGNDYRYTGVWQAGSGGYALWGYATWDSFVAKWQEWAGQGLRLVDVNAVTVGGTTRFWGVWAPGTGGYGLWSAPWDAFVAKWQDWSGHGLRLVDMASHVDAGGRTIWTGAYLPGSDGYYLWANAPWEGFRAKWQQLAAAGLRLVDLEQTEPSSAADAAGADATQDDVAFGDLWMPDAVAVSAGDGAGAGLSVTAPSDVDTVGDGGTGVIVLPDSVSKIPSQPAGGPSKDGSDVQTGHGFVVLPAASVDAVTSAGAGNGSVPTGVGGREGE